MRLLPVGRHRITATRLGRAATVVSAATLCTAVLSPTAPPVNAAPPGYSLVLDDEFDGPVNTAPDPVVWGYDLKGGWGNNEKQVYTDARENSRLDGAGNLVVEARHHGDTITSARLVTRGKHDFTYGYMEARIKLAGGQGMHPAFWLLGSNIDTVGWPASGEIDVIESINDGRTFNSGVHGPTSTSTSVSSVDSAPWKRSVGGDTGGVDLTADFHTYGILRTPGHIQTFIDGRPMFELDRADLRGNEHWVFDAPSYVILNLAVGGDWPGPVDETTRFPATMLVDWIRLYQQS
ncbi:glycoside hydrolase family 16 protein [Prescottella subtropica]|uniref:glycoside hydrolase family 16 protein n=1 Tax=Prescottella subtropica TaxID=2545757 RepID=UPI0010F7EDBF|nr:glycoside hydrolase family 16 protein [Prescottella subtropica]